MVVSTSRQTIESRSEAFLTCHFFLPGYNQWGELGLDDKEDRGDQPNEMGDNLPYVDLGDGAEVEAIALGDWHT